MRLGVSFTALALAWNILWPGLARAQPLQRRLENVKAVTCDFTVSASGTWKNGVPEAAVKPGRLSVRFDAVNLDEGTARVIGDFGPSDIVVRLSAGTLHFVQSFREGPLYATTIFLKETRAGRLAAVHTRHEFTDVSVPGYTSRPEQYYGDCELIP